MSLKIPRKYLGKAIGRNEPPSSDFGSYDEPSYHASSYLSGERPRAKTWTPGVERIETMPVVVTNNTKTSKIDKSPSTNKSRCMKRLHEIVERILKKNLESCTYDAKLARKRCTTISQIIETTIKSNLNAARCEYKVVAVVFISEQRGDGARHACQCSWDPHFDLFVSETFTATTFVAVANTFATLIERDADFTFPEIKG